jgi:hypothetical protein
MQRIAFDFNVRNRGKCFHLNLSELLALAVLLYLVTGVAEPRHV